MKRILIVLVMALAPIPVTFAQPTPKAEQTPAASPTPTGQQDQQTMQSMDKMASTVTRVAETCEKMMSEQKAAMPYILAGIITFGLVLFVDLVLLGILEVLWIKYWSRRLKESNAN